MNHINLFGYYLEMYKFIIKTPNAVKWHFPNAKAEYELLRKTIIPKCLEIHDTWKKVLDIELKEMAEDFLTKRSREMIPQPIYPEKSLVVKKLEG